MDPANILVDAAGTLHSPARGEVRIVSLVPSLTELLCDLGLAGQLVGRTGFCIHPRATVRRIAKVGGTKDVRLDALRALAPTHLVVNVDENRRETVEAAAAFVPNVIVTHPCVPEDNFALYRLCGAVFACEGAAARLCAALQGALDEAAAVRAELPAEEVLYLIWRQPWMTVGRDTYISAALAAVGWQTLPAQGAARYPEVEWGSAALAGAARVFLATEPFRFGARHVDEVAALSGRPAALIDGEMCSWYGSRAPAGLCYLAALRRTLGAREVPR